MKAEEIWESYGISDYHRLKYLGDNVNEVLEILLKNVKVGVGLFEVGSTIRALYLNDAYYDCIGFTREEYTKYESDIYATLFPEDVEGFNKCINGHAPSNEDINYVVRGYRADESLGLFDVKGVSLENKINDNPIYLTVVTDISYKKEKEDKIKELEEANEKLLLLEERYKILEGTSQGLLFEYYPKKDTMIFSYNFPDNKKRKEIPNYSEYSKRSPIVHSSYIEVFREALLTACTEEVEDSLVYLSSISGGGYRWHKTFYKSVVGADGNISSVIGRISDIHEEKMEQEKLNYKADMDGLTNLYRKEIAFDKMQEYIDEAPAGEFYFTILDLDDFKEINDKYGHQYGDTVLKKMASNLVRVFGENSIIGRFGGDEFIVLTKALSSFEVLNGLETLKFGSHFCAGVVRCKSGENIRDCFDRADRAMYQMKNKEKNGIFFSE